MADNTTRILLTAEDRTQAAFGSVQRGLAGMQNEAVRAAGALASIGFTAAAAGAVAFVRSIANAADDMAKLSQRVGISVRELGQWQLAASLSGASIESVARGVKGLSTFLKDHGDRLRAAGIDTRDASTAMTQLADIFAGMPDGLQKTALATELFGKAGMDMIPMLNLGSAGLAELRAKADDYGKRLAEIAPDAEAFNDALEELGFQSKAAAINIAGPLISGLAGLAQFMSDAAAGGERLQRAIDALKSSDSGILQQWGGMAELGRDVRQALGIDKPPTGWELAGLDPKTGRPPVAPAPASANASAALAEQRARMLLGSSGGGKASKGGKSRLDTLMEQQRARLAEMSVGDEPSGSVASVAAQYAAKEAESLAKLRAKYIDLADPLQKYREQLDEINALRADGTLTAGQALEAEWAINEAMDETAKKMMGLKDKGEDAFGGLKQAVEGWGKSAAAAFADWATGAEVSFGRVAQAAAREFIQMQAYQRFFGPIFGSVGSFIEGAFGGNASGVVLHDGGVAGAGGASRTVPSAAFAGAPRYHSGGIAGLRPDEVPAILQRGERVLPVGAGGGGTVVNVIESPGQGGQVRQRQENGQTITDVLVDRIRSVVSSDVTRGTGPISDALSRSYGLNRVAGAY